MHYLPKFPLHLNSIALLGITLLLGLLGGEIAKRIRYLPQIFGYILVGFLIGADGFNIVNQSALANAHIFIDISLSLILFELGRHLDFRWLRHDPSILCMSVTESILTFGSVFGILYFFAGMSIIQSALAATIALATSPAMVMMIAYDLSAEGPVTRRTLILTSLNNLFALILFILLAPHTQSEIKLNPFFLSIYRLFGSIIFGIMIFFITKLIANLIGKHKENQFVLYVGAVLFAIGFAHALNLSSMFTLFILGVAARNLDKKHILMEINFSWLARLFFVLLFVVTGVQIQLQGLLQVTGIIFAFVVLRLLAKIIGVWLFTKSSNLTARQNTALSFALFPMAGVAIGMSNILVDFNSDFGNKLLIIISGAVAAFQVQRPWLMRHCF